MFRKNTQHLQPAIISAASELPEKQRKRLENSWAGTFYKEFFCRIDEESFAALYPSNDSRPNVPVNVLIGLEALKSGYGWSDLVDVRLDGARRPEPVAGPAVLRDGQIQRLTGGNQPLRLRGDLTHGRVRCRVAAEAVFEGAPSFSTLRSAILEDPVLARDPPCTISSLIDATQHRRVAVAEERGPAAESLHSSWASGPAPTSRPLGRAAAATASRTSATTRSASRSLAISSFVLR